MSDAGRTVTAEGEVLWALPTAEFSYDRWEISGVESNRPEPYGRRDRALQATTAAWAAPTVPNPSR